MQTRLAAFVRDTSEGRETDAILRKCVHCGFCTATCPTYQLLGDELDGPRGRIYLLKQLLEGNPVTRTTQRHLDRCLSCLSCETTCPSGVRYGRLADIGRVLIEQRVRRPWSERVARRALRLVVPFERRFRPLLGMGRLLHPLLPRRLRSLVPSARGAAHWPAAGEGRPMVMLRGCVQPVLAPQINAAAARVAQRAGLRLFEAPGAGCCGAVSYHLGAGEEALAQMRRNVAVWSQLLESGAAEAVVVTASGCGAMIKQYGELLAGDPQFGERAATVAAHARDLSEVLDDTTVAALGAARDAPPVACHVPCTLQHAQRLPARVPYLLGTLGFALTRVRDAHLCCGSAGSYALLQRPLAERLRANKLAALSADGAACIATANIGCLHHLQGGTELPVLHWIELIDRYCAARDDTEHGS